MKRDHSSREHRANPRQASNRRAYLKGIGAVGAAGLGVLTTIGTAGAAEPLPEALAVRSASMEPAMYSLSASDAIELGELANPNEDRIEGTTASGTVASREDRDSYRFAGALTHVTDEETYEAAIDPGAGRIVLAPLDGFDGALRYSFSVDGTLRAVETNSEDNVWWYLGYGAIDTDPDVYAYTGRLKQLIVERSVDVEVTT